MGIETNIIGNGQHIVPDIIASIDNRLELYKLDKADFRIGMGSQDLLIFKMRSLVL